MGLRIQLQSAERMGWLHYHFIIINDTGRVQIDDNTTPMTNKLYLFIYLFIIKSYTQYKTDRMDRAI